MKDYQQSTFINKTVMLNATLTLVEKARCVLIQTNLPLKISGWLVYMHSRNPSSRTVCASQSYIATLYSTPGGNIFCPGHCFFCFGSVGIWCSSVSFYVASLFPISRDQLYLWVCFFVFWIILSSVFLKFITGGYSETVTYRNVLIWQARF